MGCSVCCGYWSGMSLWGGGSRDELDAQTRAARKLYLARESPEPEFDASACGLRSVPPGTYALCRVLAKHRLLLHDNCLQSLGGGGALADLHALTVLNLSSNKFHKLPDEIRLLVNLKELDVSNNILSQLPECVGELSNLISLNLSQNSLYQLPRSLGLLKSLSVLKLCDNPDLTRLCPELHGASNIVEIELDAETFVFPPTDVAREGTVPIMMFLCNAAGVIYYPPSAVSPLPKPIMSPDYLNKTFQKELQLEQNSREAAEVAERELHKAAVLQRQKFLSEILKEQSQLDAEISKIRTEREMERAKLVKEIQKEERTVAAVIDTLISSRDQRPDALQQELEHERTECDRLLALCHDNYRSVRTADVLRAMETALEEQAALQATLRSHEAGLGDVKRNALLQEYYQTDKLEQVLKVSDATRSSLVEQLLRDEDVQKAAVASLLERLDSRSWSLRQEICIVAANLAKLSAIEQDKRRLQVNYNYDLLLHQRVQLLELLDDLLKQQSRRRGQLVLTLKEMEMVTDRTTDYWLANYQRLMDSAPKTLLDAGRTLDPFLANCLLQEGVIHCLPFLVKFMFTNSLADVTNELLKENGVNLTTDREGILRAIKIFLETKTKEKNVLLHEEKTSSIAPSCVPSAPELTEEKEVPTGTEEQNGTVKSSGATASECVICMDCCCEVVFTPCGHLCCCLRCADNKVLQCPMCRVTIEKKIRVIIP